jgi:hypothetical protein
MTMMTKPYWLVGFCVGATATMAGGTARAQSCPDPSITQLCFTVVTRDPAANRQKGQVRLQVSVQNAGRAPYVTTPAQQRVVFDTRSALAPPVDVGRGVFANLTAGETVAVQSDRLVPWDTAIEFPPRILATISYDPDKHDDCVSTNNHLEIDGTEISRAIATGATGLVCGHPVTPLKTSPLFQRALNANSPTLRGFVDLHTHPMSHLGFGGHFVHGAPDVGAILPPGQLYSSAGSIFGGGTNCNERDVVATSMDQALGSCAATHGGSNPDGNKCGNNGRRLALYDIPFSAAHGTNPGEAAVLANPGSPIIHTHGAPSFEHWPKANDTQHQQMWIDWIRRAYDGGMRVMVGLAVNSMTISKGIAGTDPVDDAYVGNRQIRELTAMVARHGEWMEVARTSADLRRIVRADKLAIIIGVELDDIGSFSWTPRGTGDAGVGRPPTEAQVVAEIDRLYGLGVRYIFPVHVIDNHFGGTALYNSEFPRANRYQFGAWPSIGCAAAADGITKVLSSGDDAAKALILGQAGGHFPIPSCPPHVGVVNTRGLTALGRFAIKEMMNRSMLIDIDHMSQQTVTDTLALTAVTPSGEPYPLASGHNGLRGGFESGTLGARQPDISENTRTPAQYRAITDRLGVAGVGWGDSNAADYLANVRKVLALNPRLSLNIGSDINGLVGQPSNLGCTRCVTYSAAFPQARTGTRVWDYNVDGVAHIGLFPDFLRHVENIGGRDVVDTLFDGAEGIARMWEQSEHVMRRAALTLGVATSVKLGRNGAGGVMQPVHLSLTAVPLPDTSAVSKANGTCTFDLAYTVSNLSDLAAPAFASRVTVGTHTESEHSFARLAPKASEEVVTRLQLTPGQQAIVVAVDPTNAAHAYHRNGLFIVNVTGMCR